MTGSAGSGPALLALRPGPFVPLAGPGRDLAFLAAALPFPLMLAWSGSLLWLAAPLAAAVVRFLAGGGAGPAMWLGASLAALPFLPPGLWLPGPAQAIGTGLGPSIGPALLAASAAGLAAGAACRRPDLIRHPFLAAAAAGLASARIWPAAGPPPEAALWAATAAAALGTVAALALLRPPWRGLLAAWAVWLAAGWAAARLSGLPPSAGAAGPWEAWPALLGRAAAPGAFAGPALWWWLLLSAYWDEAARDPGPLNRGASAALAAAAGLAPLWRPDLAALAISALPLWEICRSLASIRAGRALLAADDLGRGFGAGGGGLTDSDHSDYSDYSGHSELAAQPGQENQAGKSEQTDPARELVAFRLCARPPAPPAALYLAAPSCRLAEELDGGPHACPQACLGHGDCLRACPRGAMASGRDGAPPEIDPDRCRACGLCVQACPRDLLILAPRRAAALVACRGSAWMRRMDRLCPAGCLGCGLCRKACPAGAVARRGRQAPPAVDQAACLAGRPDCGQACRSACPRSLPGPPVRDAAAARP